MVTIVNSTAMCTWNLPRVDLKCSQQLQPHKMATMWDDECVI